MKMKKISVCIATYNGEKYLKKQLDSILNQLNKEDEVIISDDTSTDATVETIKAYNDRRIILIENQKFRSPIYNFENALKHASGDIIFLADQDDIWIDNKVCTVKKYLKIYDLVISDAEIIDTNDETLYRSFYALNNSRKGFIKNIIKNSYLGCCMAFNRKILESALPFPKNVPMHDWWIGLISEMTGESYFINEKLVRYRRHNNNASTTGEKSKYSFFKKVLFRLRIIQNLMIKKIKEL